MKIGEVSRRSGVAARMLRYYEEQELLRPARHPNGYRDYGEDDLDRVVVIRDLTGAGLPVRFIKIVLDRRNDPTAWTSACDDTFAAMVREQILDLDAKITCLRTSRGALSQVLEDAGRSSGVVSSAAIAADPGRRATARGSRRRPAGDRRTS